MCEGFDILPTQITDIIRYPGVMQFEHFIVRTSLMLFHGIWHPDYFHKLQGVSYNIYSFGKMLFYPDSQE